MWFGIIDWFGDVKERYVLIRDFNKSAKGAFIIGLAPTLLEAKVTVGSMEYRHAFSKFMAGGFRIKALSGQALRQSELIEIGKIILDNDTLVRKLVALGWDTLEVNDVKGFKGCKWALKDYAHIGGYLQ